MLSHDGRDGDDGFWEAHVLSRLGDGEDGGGHGDLEGTPPRQSGDLTGQARVFTGMIPKEEGIRQLRVLVSECLKVHIHRSMRCMRCLCVLGANWTDGLWVAPALGQRSNLAKGVTGKKATGGVRLPLHNRVQ